MQENKEQKKEQGHPGQGHGQDKKLDLRFIVNGKAIEVKEKVSVLLKEAVERALKKSGNEGRPLSDWNVKYADRALDMNKTLAELNLPDNAELFLSLNAGQGGSF